MGRRGSRGAAGLVGEGESSGTEGASPAALRHLARQQRFYTERLSFTARHCGGGAGDGGGEGCRDRWKLVSFVAGEICRHSPPPSPVDTALLAGQVREGLLEPYRWWVPCDGLGREVALGATNGREAADASGAVCGRGGGHGRVWRLRGATGVWHHRHHITISHHLYH